MIRFTQGDLFDADVEALVNTVNCVGVMGRGIALQFKKAFPENFRAYATACKAGEVTPGSMFVFATNALSGPQYIINFPTKRHWRGKSRIEDIQSGLNALRAEVVDRGIQSIAVPPLGSGLGGLNWAEVKPLIEKSLSQLQNVDIVVYEPGAPIAKKRVQTASKPKMTPGRAALLSLMKCYLAGLMDPSISLLEIHKLMYFLQSCGEPLRLRYVRGHYGPYAENLRHVLAEIEGHFITGYSDGGDDPTKPLEALPEAFEAAEQFLGSHEETHRHIDRVSNLVWGFETPFGLELLATVHWIANEGKATNTDELIKKTHEWSSRKCQFTPKQIALAQEHLAAEGWIARV